MAKFEAGNDPADHTNAEVVDYLNGDECTPDEYERIMAAERGNRARVGILNLTGVETPDETGQPEVDPASLPVDLQPTPDETEQPETKGEERPQYDEDAPSQLGPDFPVTQAEQEAHDASVAALSKAEYNSLPADRREGAVPVRSKPFTPAEALQAASERVKGWARPDNTISPAADDES